MKKKKRGMHTEKRGRKTLDLKAQYHEARAFLRTCTPYIYFSLALFILSAVFGFVFQAQLTFIDDILRDLILRTDNLSSLELVFFILQNNLQSSFVSLLLGFFLGFFPIMSTVSNGVILGYVLERSYQLVGLLSWWRLLPHGIFELPAIFISFGVGLKLGVGVLRTYYRYYLEKSKAMLVLPFLLAIISFVVSVGVLVSGDQVLSGVLAQMSLPFVIAIQFVWSIVLYVLLFVFFTYVFNPRLRSLHDAHLRTGLYNALNVFLTIIIPLLIIAAIIEGILIGLSV